MFSSSNGMVVSTVQELEKFKEEMAAEEKKKVF
jgi:hypothetical protein